MPNETKKDFCCLIITGFGAGVQSGIILHDHLQGSGIDTFLTTPSGTESLRVEQEHWIHGIRMRYLALRKQYNNVALIGLSIGGTLLMHVLDLNPAAIVFVNTPVFQRTNKKEFHRIFDADLKAKMHGLLREHCGKYELRRLIASTKQCKTYHVTCPALILQTQDDCVCDPSNADDLFKLLQMREKSMRLYPEGGHDVLMSRTVMAVCSDIFQFCSRVRAMQIEG